MIENRAVILLDESDRTMYAPGNGPQIVSFELDILGESLSFRVEITRKQARLSDMAALARMLCDRICAAVVNKLRADGTEISCRKGCSACCRYLVPLSVPEAFRLREDISVLPVEQGKAILQLCLDTAKKILEKHPDGFASDPFHGTDDPPQTRRICGWYAGLDLPCPFLSKDACVSYDRRPIACREHLVTSPAAWCDSESTDEPSVVPIPFSVLECLGELAAQLEQSEVEAVMLPLALPWALKNHDRSQRTWPTAEMVERLAEILKTAAKKTQVGAEVHA